MPIAGTKTVPVLVPKPHGDLASLVRAIDLCRAKGIAYLADPVLDPIHFGFMTSLERYAELRRERPDVEILMGTGNLTELTDADSQGVTAMLLGICSELQIRNVLVVQVSPHTRRTIQEHDAARRLMYRAREDESLPKGYGGGLLSLHDLRPYPDTPEQIASARRARPELPHRGRRGRYPHLQPRRPPRRRAMPSRCSTSSASRPTAHMRSTSAMSSPRPRSRTRLASAIRRTARLDWGVAADRQGRGPDAARARRRYAQSRAQGEGGCRISSKRS